MEHPSARTTSANRTLKHQEEKKLFLLVIGGPMTGLLLAVPQCSNPKPKLSCPFPFECTGSIFSLLSLLTTIKPLPLHTTHCITKVSLSLVSALMATFTSLSHSTFSLAIYLLLFAVSVRARPATFLQDFKITWSDSHIRQIGGGKAIQLILDQTSGCGFASKSQYLFGRVSMKIKLIAGDSAGTVTAFYMNSDTDNVRDELDFEFLGNRTGQPYTVQTNVYAHGKGDREQRINLWFDPAAEYHTYSILWNHHHVVFSIDEVPIRVYKNNEARGLPFPKFQPMGVYSTLWEADDWATRGGLEKIDWSKAPFYAYYMDFDIEGCVGPGQANCASNPNNWWEGPAYQQLNAVQAERYKWVRMNHMIYDYCADKSRYPVTPPECMYGI